jgi:hypothetical protein
LGEAAWVLGAAFEVEADALQGQVVGLACRVGVGAGDEVVDPAIALGGGLDAPELQRLAWP